MTDSTTKNSKEFQAKQKQKKERDPMKKETPRSWWMVVMLMGAILIVGWGAAAAVESVAKDIVDTAVSAGPGVGPICAREARLTQTHHLSRVPRD